MSFCHEKAAEVADGGDTIHFVPLPRLVLPTPEPLFSRERNYRPGRSRPIAADPPHPIRPAGPAAPLTKPLPPPTTSADASRWKGKEKYPAENAMPPRFAESTGCPRNRLGSTQEVGHAYPAAASVWETPAQSAATAPRRWTQTATLRPPLDCRTNQCLVGAVSPLAGASRAPTLHLLRLLLRCLLLDYPPEAFLKTL